MEIRFGFTQDGGFVAVDDERKFASYAYPTSSHAVRATAKPAIVAAKMLADDARWTRNHFTDEAYEHLRGRI